MIDYQQQAMRTAAPLADNCADFVHGALGLVDESHELMAAVKNQNALEEMGDICWFTALCGTALNKTPFDGIQPIEPTCTPSRTLTEISEHASHIAAIAKKWHAYGRPAEPLEAMFHLRCIVVLVTHYAKFLGLTLEQVQQANIRKLQARYPDKFSQERALNRNTAAEYAAMGGDQ